MSQDKCTIQVNGAEFEARPGQMLIEVTDAAGIYVPRFCYHSKLSIAANCRMCLVEVEGAPKPMPACATPVTPGMKVQTKSAKAVGSQKATMEFLLINHPLDCPICDQGGECELQDLAMGFGRDVSRYTERKRVVRDKDIGPLVSTDMTRCIHCTRCVRFTQEIAGYQELGTIGRGDRVEIAPYIERGVDHELSGNIIDLCPVGALNSKPFRFSARAWEMSQHEAIAPHDCIGSHLYVHVMGGRVKRVVPRACEALNETWLADRDRFSYEGLDAPDRLQQPMIRDETGWRPAGWDEALDAAAAGLKAAAEGPGGSVGALVSPSATTEEGYLLARLMGHLGSANLDYRLRRRDFRGQDDDAPYPSLGMELSAVERLQQLLVVGSNIRKEVPLLAHRIRKAALRGAAVRFVNPASYPFLFPVAGYAVGDPADYWLELATLVLAAGGGEATGSPEHAAIFARAPAPGDEDRRTVEAMRAAERSAILLGHISLRHPDFAVIDWLANELARLTGSALGHASEGANAAGLSLAGVLPHRSTGGRPRPAAGATAGDMTSAAPSGMVLLGVEPSADCAAGAAAAAAIRRTDFVVALSPFFGEEIKELARVVLPVTTFAESAGTYVNAEGRWQSFDAVARAPGDTRPAWKVLRVLGNRLQLPGCDYATWQAIRDELRAELQREPQAPPPARRVPSPHAGGTTPSLAELDVPMYQIDPLLRRAGSLQRTHDARRVGAVGDARRRA
jgi:NADH-quinone oxidoreductase subunit G